MYVAAVGEMERKHGSWILRNVRNIITHATMIYMYNNCFCQGVGLSSKSSCRCVFNVYIHIYIYIFLNICILKIQVYIFLMSKLNNSSNFSVRVDCI